MNQFDEYSVAIAAVRKGMSNNGRPLFQAPWQARIFALIVEAVEVGRFPWTDFQTRLAAALARNTETVSTEGDEIGERRYFDAWLQAAEETLLARGLIGPGEIDSRIESVRAAVDRIRNAQQRLDHDDF